MGRNGSWGGRIDHDDDNAKQTPTADISQARRKMTGI